jgi:hypothetical protein
MIGATMGTKGKDLPDCRAEGPDRSGRPGWRITPLVGGTIFPRWIYPV